MCNDHRNITMYKKPSEISKCSKTYEDYVDMSTLSRIMGQKISKGHVSFTRVLPLQKYILKNYL